MSEKQERVFINFYRFMVILCKVNLTLEEQRLIIWHYYNSISFRKMRKMTGYRISAQRIQQIVAKGISKLRKRFKSKIYSAYFK